MRISFHAQIVRAAVISLGIWCCSGGGSADAAQQPQPQRALFDLIVNQVGKGEVTAVLVDKDIWIPVAALEDAGVRTFEGDRHAFYGIPSVRLASLSPGILTVLDERELTLHITVEPARLSTTRLSLTRGAPAGIIYSRARSGFLNYAVDMNGQRAYSLFADAGATVGGALLASTLSRSAHGSLVRGQTSLTVDDRRRVRRWVIGDSFASTGSLGGALFIGGVSVSREYEVDPYFMRYPTADLAGAVLAPSTLEVYVNNRLVSREQIAPGRFDLTSLPVSTGRADARLVLRDAFGREQQVVSSFYLATGGLAAGLHEYRYHAGYRRQDASGANWRYSSPACLGRHRVGLTDTITAGMRAELDGGIISVGPLLNLQLPFGELEFASGGSRRGSDYGGAASARYSYVGASHNLAAGVRYVSPQYTTVGAVDNPSRPRWEASLSAGVPLGVRSSLSFRHEISRRHDDSGGSTTSLLASVRVSRRAHLSVTGTNDWRDRRSGFQVSAGIGVVFGSRTSATLSQAVGGGARGASLDLQQSLPAGTGYGYRVSSQLESAQGSSGFQYQGPFGRYEVWHDRTAAGHGTSIRAAGGLVGIGGNIYATRSVQDGFALVRVPGVPGVRGYASNQPVGRTDRNGNLLIPDLLPYYGNRLSIADQDVPMDRSVEATQRIVAPPFRGGALVVFPVRPFQNSTGRVVLLRAGERIVPVFGQLTVLAGGRTYESPIGDNGEFYLENAPAGRYTAQILYQQRTCELTITIGASTNGVLDLGLVECAVPEGGSH